MTVIHTKRFTLRPVCEADAPVLAVLCNDETLARNTARIPHPYTPDNALAFIRYMQQAQTHGTEFAFAAHGKDGVAGCCGVMRDNDAWEIGYWVAAAARGEGVATEIAGAVTQFAFDTLQTETLAAGYFIDNPASAKVLEKLGFRTTGEVRKIHSLGRGCEVETPRMVLHASEFVRPAGVRIESAR